jgi:hypothetical protein
VGNSSNTVYFSGTCHRADALNPKPQIGIYFGLLKEASRYSVIDWAKIHNPPYIQLPVGNNGKKVSNAAHAPSRFILNINKHKTSMDYITMEYISWKMSISRVKSNVAPAILSRTTRLKKTDNLAPITLMDRLPP